MLTANMHAPVKVALIDLDKMHKAFYEAAWWIAEAQSAHIESQDALVHNWRLTVLQTLLGPNTYQPRTQTMEDDRLRVNHNAIILTEGFMLQFLDRLARGGPPSALAYAQSLEVQRIAARNKVFALCQSAFAHDMELAAQAEAVRKTLVLTMFACELALVVVSLMIAFPVAAAAAVGGPVVVGASGVSAGVISAAITTGYGMAAEAVKDSPERAAAVAVSCKSGTAQGAAGYLGDTMKESAEHNTMHHLKSFRSAVKQVNVLNRQIESATNPGSAMLAKLERVPASWNVTTTGAGLKVAKTAGKAASFVKNGLPLVFAVHDVMEAGKKLKENWDQ